MTMRAENTPKSRTCRASKLEGLSFLRISLRFLGIDHMGPPERISSAHLLNEEISPFQGLNLAILPKLYYEVVKDLGMISQSHNKESEEKARLGHIDKQLGA